MSNVFITFEGIDACGKSVQSQRLAKKLRARGKSVILIRDPGTTSISERIRGILLDAQNKELYRETELLLFSAARAQMVAETILPGLNAGSVVICDRFYDSTTAYQGFGRGLDLQFISQINAFASQNRPPDITFFIDIPLSVARKRQQLATDQLDRMEIESTGFRKKVREGFLQIARAEPNRIRVIDGNNTIENIENQIWDITARKMKIE